MCNNPKKCKACGRALTIKRTIRRGVCKKCVARDCDVQVQTSKNGRVYITESLFTRGQL